APAAQRLARLVVHADGNLAMLEGRHRLHAWVAVEHRANDRLVSEQRESEIRQPGESNLGAGQDNFRPLVAAHDVERSRDRCRHPSPYWPRHASGAKITGLPLIDKGFLPDSCVL